MNQEELINRFPRLYEAREVVAEYAFAVNEISQTLKVKVEKYGDNSYMGIANLKVKGSTCADFYRSLTFRETVDEAMNEALSGFFAFLDDGAEIQEVDDW